MELRDDGGLDTIQVVPAIKGDQVQLDGRHVVMLTGLGCACSDLGLQSVQDDFRSRLELFAEDWATFFVVKSCLHPHAFCAACGFLEISGVRAATEPSFHFLQLVVGLPLFAVQSTHQ